MYIYLERVFSVHRGIRPQYHTDPFSQPPRGILSAAERLGKDHGIRFFVTKVLLDPFLLEPFVSFDTLRGSRRRLLLRGGRLRWERFLRRPCRRRTAAAAAAGSCRWGAREVGGGGAGQAPVDGFLEGCIGVQRLLCPAAQFD